MKARRSTTSWTIPKPGDVLNYAYLWDHEARRGLEEGLKDRPAVVVLTVGGNPRHPVVTVCPVTSQQPAHVDDYVQLPQQVKNHLTLTDRNDSYVVTTEVNRFTWPGPDVRPLEVRGRTDVIFGQVPARLLDTIKQSMIANIRRHKLKTTSRA